jgi:predicted dehydrogenase
MNRKLRMGMIGGGPGAFIGTVHRMAAALDQQIELVCGVFSSDPGKSTKAGTELGLPPERVYGSYKEMLRRESELPFSQKMEIVSIVTPNHLHFEPAKLALENGFHVIMDKPLTLDLEEAHELKKIHDASGKLFCLTYTYAGYPMIKEARQQVADGKLGKIRKVLAEYTQGWLYNTQEHSGNKQAEWRTDPARSGVAGATGDIGTHAFHLAEYITGLEVTSILAELQRTIEGRKLDDDATVILRFNNGATGALIATQVATGEENDLRIRVYGEKAGLEWTHRDPNTLIIRLPGEPDQYFRAGNDYLGTLARHNTRTPAGHPEGFIEAFANHYRNFTFCIRAQMNNEEARDEWKDFPGMNEGVRGMAFVEASVKSAGKWVELDLT